MEAEATASGNGLAVVAVGLLARILPPSSGQDAVVAGPGRSGLNRVAAACDGGPNEPGDRRQRAPTYSSRLEAAPIFPPQVCLFVARARHRPVCGTQGRLSRLHGAGRWPGEVRPGILASRGLGQRGRHPSARDAHRWPPARGLTSRQDGEGEEPRRSGDWPGVATGIGGYHPGKPRPVRPACLARGVPAPREDRRPRPLGRMGENLLNVWPRFGQGHRRPLASFPTPWPKPRDPPPGT